MVEKLGIRGFRLGDVRLWMMVRNNRPGGYCVTDNAEGGIPRPIALVHDFGQGSLSLAVAVLDRPGDASLWSPIGRVRAEPHVIDYRDLTLYRTAEILNETALWPIDQHGGMLVVGGRFAGGTFKRERGKMVYECSIRGRMPIPFRANKNGSSELAIHTPKLGGKGRELVATPTAA